MRLGMKFCFRAARLQVVEVDEGRARTRTRMTTRWMMRAKRRKQIQGPRRIMLGTSLPASSCACFTNRTLLLSTNGTSRRWERSKRTGVNIKIT